MATFISNSSHAFDIDSVDLNWYYRNAIDSDLLKNVNSVVEGRTYSDVFYTIGSSGGVTAEINFGGTDLAGSSSAITGGLVTGVAEFYGDLATWLLADISTSAASVYNAAVSPNTADEKAIFASALAGADNVTLSQLGDHFAAYGGNDTIFGLGGNDRIAAGDGDDIVYGGDGDDQVDPGFGADLIYGDAGNDRFYFTGVRIGPTAGIGLIDGGSGNDTLDLSNITPTTLGIIQDLDGNYVNGIYVGSQKFELRNIETIRLGPGGNYVDIAARPINGGIFYTGSGNDQVFAQGNASIFSEDGDDLVMISGTFGSTSFGSVAGGSGVDTLLANIGSTLDLRTATLTSGGATWQFSGFEKYQISTGFDSAAYGDDAANDISVSTAREDGSIGVTIDGLGGNDNIRGSMGNDVLKGGAGDDIVSGGSGNDLIVVIGHDAIDGGEGLDTLLLSSFRVNYTPILLNGQIYLVGAPDGAKFSGIEQIQFADQLASITQLTSKAKAFDPLAYIASHPDLLQGYGANAAAGMRHFTEHGFSEGRGVSFDPLAYVASYPDLLQGLGPDATAGARHYIEHGYYEGRSVGFDPLAYIATYPDLLQGFGTDADAGVRHYIEQGFVEGRSILFDPLAYIASHPDLLQGYGANAQAGLLHYIEHGFAEGRSVSFDALAYGAGYVDLAQGLGDNIEALTRHYIEHGFAEGRVPDPGFDEVGYLLSNADLASAGIGADAALEHWLLHGVNEGRLGDALYGREQIDHALSATLPAQGSLINAEDHDWFIFSGQNDQTIEIDYSSLAIDGAIELYRSNGQLLAESSTGSKSASLTYHLAENDNYYAVVHLDYDVIQPGQIGILGSYQLDLHYI